MSLPTFQHEAMATFFEIVIAGHEFDYARRAARAAWQEIDRLESELSRFIETSSISRANRLGRGEALVLDEDAFECLLIAADVSVATGRAFDPAYASLRPADLAPDLPPFTLDPTTHSLTSLTDKLRLDLGAVGKGYALDRVATLLADWGVDCALLNAGGSSLLALGTPFPEDAGWPLGVGDGSGYREIIVTGASLSGSGTAVKGAHLLDPRTGAPAKRTHRVWALAPTGAQADALSTAFFVMNEAEIAACCASHARIGAAITAASDELVAHGALRDALLAGS
jgi:thiamine biosynthesis lipoprotein